MKKQLKSSTVYQPNAGVKVTVVNKPIFDEVGTALGFDTDVTIKVKMVGRPQELKFSTDDQLSDFVNNVDFADPQQALPLDRAGRSYEISSGDNKVVIDKNGIHAEQNNGGNE